jgi:ABC-type transport system involved in multi-copper enzyme maturation permease subunit
MFLRIVAFEIRYQLRQPLFWATAGIFALLAFVVTTTDAFQIGGAIGSLNRNAPYVVARLLGSMSVMGAFMVVAFVAGSALRDFERGTAELVFSRPVRPRDLLLGRFFGSLIAACVCFASAALGILIGSLMPWLDPERVGPFDVSPHLYGLLVLAFPSFAILGAALFALATRVRHAIATYVALVALLVAYSVAAVLFGDLETRSSAAILDPFGLVAFEQVTRYWTVVEKNSRLPPLTGALLWNRLSWLSLASAVLVWAVARFRYERAASLRGRRRPAVPALLEGAETRIRRPPGLAPGAVWSQLVSQFRLEARAVLGGLPFLLILAFGLINILSNMGQLDLMLGTPVWPVTHLMLLAVRAGYSFLLVVIITFYAGEMVWRERSLRLDGVLDATPRATSVPLVAKLLALWTAVSVFIVAGILGLIGFQLSHGYTRLEPLLYAQGFVVETLPFLLTAALALFLQVAINHKFGGYLAMVLYLVSSGALTALHFDHNLYRYAGVPSAPYSDMNGWGHFAAPVFWFNLYWTLAAGVLLCLAYAGWVRGHEPGFRLRWAEMRARLRGGVRVAVVLLLAAFGATGGFIFYNTNILNEYVPSDEAVRRQAEYEKKFAEYRDLPQPRILGVRADVDIFPAMRRADIRGSYRLANRSNVPIAALHVGLPPRVEVRRLDLPPHLVVLDDRRLGHAVYQLEEPLAPGQEIRFGFELRMSNPGFVNNNPDNTVVENGTFFHSRQFPSFGYRDDRELADPSERRRQGLPPPRRMATIENLEARQRNDLAADADWLDFETTVSTDAGQIALAPGTLKREWTEGGRRYFHYEMDSPIPKFFAYLSARYAVRRDSWKDVGIEVFYHPGHEYNLDRMVDAVKKTLAYMTDNFSPYQHAHVRIVEFPRYTRGAVSFPNTIPFSESVGFIARLEDPEAIDYPFYVTAHEVAHQWWGYQVMGADVQGATMLSESMAQYSSLMVMEREYGAEKMRRFLKYELDRYLSGRGGQLVEELPLERVENQPYIHYSKGSLVLYALKDQIDEAPLNAALRRYVSSVRFAPPPYTVSRDLMASVAEAMPPEKTHLLDDLFRSITLFDNQTVDVASRALGNGRYEVSLKARARKLRADGRGVETEAPLDDWIDVGVFAEPATSGGRKQEQVLYLEKRHVTSPEVAVQVVVEGLPARAGIDPYNKLIDRTPTDNTRAVAHR